MDCRSIADFIILGIVLLSCVISVIRGFVKESISLATWLPPSVHSLSTADAAAEPKITPRNNNKANKAAIERTRKQVRMLDDLYKTAVVLITTHYVKDETSFPAGGAAVALFDAIHTIDRPKIAEAIAKECARTGPGRKHHPAQFRRSRGGATGGTPV